MNLHITPSFNIDRLCKTASVLLFLVHPIDCHVDLCKRSFSILHNLADKDTRYSWPKAMPNTLFPTENWKQPSKPDTPKSWKHAGWMRRRFLYMERLSGTAWYLLVRFVFVHCHTHHGDIFRDFSSAHSFSGREIWRWHRAPQSDNPHNHGSTGPVTETSFYSDH